MKSSLPCCFALAPTNDYLWPLSLPISSLGCSRLRMCIRSEPPLCQAHHLQIPYHDTCLPTLPEVKILYFGADDSLAKAWRQETTVSTALVEAWAMLAYYVFLFCSILNVKVWVGLYRKDYQHRGSLLAGRCWAYIRYCFVMVCGIGLRGNVVAAVASDDDIAGQYIN